jgi:beta-lactamase class A
MLFIEKMIILVVGKYNISYFLLKIKNVKRYLKGWGVSLRDSQIKRKKMLEIFREASPADLADQQKNYSIVRNY